MDSVYSRFVEKFEVRDSGCWEWKYNSNVKYHTFFFNKTVSAHRFSFMMYNNRFDLLVRPEIFVCHKCDNTHCVNPDHLFEGTHVDNMNDMILKGRQHNQNKMECPHGHPYNKENTFNDKEGRRRCYTCQRARKKKAYALSKVKNGKD